jgi:AraC-like DNA-binding protein
MMSYQEIHSPGGLESFIDCEWSLYAEHSRDMVHPDGYADLLFDTAGRIYICGVTSKTRQLDPAQSVDLRGLRLKAGAIPFFFGVSAWEFRNQVRPTSDVSSSLARAMTAMAQQADSRAELFRAILKLLSQKCSAKMPDGRLAFALFQAERKPVRAVARALGMTERHLHRLFLDQVGLSPSKFRRVLRLQRVIDAMRRLPADQTMASFALDHGFFDQAHMNHELKHLTGMTPAALHRSVVER